MRTPFLPPRLLLLIALALCIGCRRPRPQLASGDEWLSWTREKRQIFVGGYLDGTQNGQQALCNNLVEEVEVLKLRKPPTFADPCDQFKTRYSHMGVGTRQAYTDAYVSVIDDFYKHPDCREMPYPVILGHLNDKEYRSGENLYKLVHHGGAAWGAFSAFDEAFYKCYP